ncbi:MAG: ribulose-phosphate 3-epimerase [Polyangia bacterium]|jgi:ribulose-phosphate 3-epimerase
MTKKVEICASILAADFTRLGDHMREADAAGVDRFHLDVMDGRFVPNISFGPMVVGAARKVTRTFLEAHLMIVEPERYIPEFASAGADLILVHQEACPHLHGTLQQIRGLGKRAGVVINPATPLATIEDVLPEVEQVLLMSVNPGFGGQRFIASTLAKVARLREMIAARGLVCAIEVDGGISPANAGEVAKAGATLLVAGVSVFRAPEGVAEAVGRLRASAG